MDEAPTPPVVEELIADGAALYHRGDLQGAAEQWQRAAALAPTDVRARGYLSWINACLAGDETPSAIGTPTAAGTGGAPSRTPLRAGSLPAAPEEPGSGGATARRGTTPTAGWPPPGAAAALGGAAPRSIPRPAPAAIPVDERPIPIALPALERAGPVRLPATPRPASVGPTAREFPTPLAVPAAAAAAMGRRILAPPPPSLPEPPPFESPSPSPDDGVVVEISDEADSAQIEIVIERPSAPTPASSAAPPWRPVSPSSGLRIPVDEPALDLLSSARLALDRGAVDEALILAERAVAKVGIDGPELIAYGDVLQRVYGAYLGDRSRYLAVGRMPPDLDPRSAFLLSRIDGTLTVEDVLDVSGMTPLEGTRALALLIRRGALTAR